jgi:Phosphotransferase enzyme family
VNWQPTDREWRHTKLQAFLRARSTRSAVRDALQAMLSSDTELGTCRWRRVKARPGRKLSVWLDATISQRSQRTVRPVALEWAVDPAERTEASATGNTAPFHRLTLSGDFFVRVSPFDPEFPNLAKLLDVHRVRTLDPALSEGLTIATVRYRPGERHVLRFDDSTSKVNVEPRFVKLARPGDGQRVVDAATRFADAVNANGRLVVGPLGVIDDAAVYPSTGGLAMSRLDPSRPDSFDQWMYRAGQSAARIHGVSTTTASIEHSVDNELAIAARAVRHIGELAPQHRGTVEEIVERLWVAATSTDPVRVVTLHGDIKLDHLHRCNGQLLVIDIDRAGHGEAAIDLGNLMADIRWWGRADPAGHMDAAVAEVVRGYDDSLAESPRVRLTEAVGLLRIAGRRPQLTSPSWLVETTGLLDTVGHLTDRLERELGVSSVRRSTVRRRPADAASASTHRPGQRQTGDR